MPIASVRAALVVDDDDDDDDDDAELVWGCCLVHVDDSLLPIDVGAMVGLRCCWR